MQTAAIYARAVDIARIYKLVKSCDGSFDAKKNIVHAIIDYITYERVDNTHKNGKYDIRRVLWKIRAR